MAVIRAQVAKVGDLKDGQMQEAKVGEKKVLLSRVNGKYYATSHLCTHYKAPLVKGTLSADGRVVCPWHGACFRVQTGDIEDAPGLDALYKYKVEIEGDNVFVTANEEELASGMRVPCSKISVSDARVFVIIGGGAAGMGAAQALREYGFGGKVIMLSKESVLPIDRTKLSKAVKVETDKILLRKANFFTEFNIEVQLNTEVVSVDTGSKKVQLKNGSFIIYDRLLLASGGLPRALPVKGKDLGNIFLIRGVEHASQLEKAMEGLEKPNIVIVGSSFIGMEAAAVLVKSSSSVTVIGMEKAPFERVLGLEIGRAMQKLHESKGVHFKMEAVISHYEPRDGDETKVGSVLLSDGTKLPADIVILGVGVRPDTDFLKQSPGFELERDGSIVANEFMQVTKGEIKDVFAAGDIVRFPLFLTKEETRIEHWDVAMQQGRIAAYNMISDEDAKPFETVPYFWTAQYGKSLRYAGHALHYDDVIIEGDLEIPEFVAYYVAGDACVGVASLGKDPYVSHCAELMRCGVMLSTKELRDKKSPLEKPIPAKGDYVEPEDDDEEEEDAEEEKKSTCVAM